MEEIGRHIKKGAKQNDVYKRGKYDTSMAIRDAISLKT